MAFIEHNMQILLIVYNYAVSKSIYCIYMYMYIVSDKQSVFVHMNLVNQSPPNLILFCLFLHVVHVHHTLCFQLCLHYR